VPLVVNNPCLLPMVSPKLLPVFDYNPLLMGKWKKNDISMVHSRILFPILRAISVLFIEGIFGKKFNEIRKSIGIRPIKMLEFPPPNVPILVNSFWGLEYPRPVSPLIHMVGPLGFSRDVKDTPTDPRLESFMSEKKNGIIYISMGTLAQMQDNNLEIFKKNIEDFARLKQFKFIWKTKELEEQQSENVIVTKWVPSQSALLKDERVVAFISHCGINSAQESIYYGKPILCIPMFGDQMDMAQRIEESGSGIILSKDRLSDTIEFSRKLEQLLTDLSFSKNAKRMSIFLRGSGGAQEAARLVSMYSQIQKLGVPEMIVGEVKSSKKELPLLAMLFFVLFILALALNRC
jgi:UDP:flavonoid glycosyltransferase YjiC (YdhE family)